MAQSAAPAAGSNETIPEKAPATTGNTPPPGTTLDTQSGTLSNKLNATGGVIAPTDNVDPAMAKPAPKVGTMPVITPGQAEKGSGTGGLY